MGLHPGLQVGSRQIHANRTLVPHSKRGRSRSDVYAVTGSPGDELDPPVSLAAIGLEAERQLSITLRQSHRLRLCLGDGRKESSERGGQYDTINAIHDSPVT